MELIDTNTGRVSLKKAVDKDGPAIGRGQSSETTDIKCWVDGENNINYWDCPGFNDSRGVAQQIANTLLVKQFASSRDTSILFVMRDYSMFNESNNLNADLVPALNLVKKFFGSITTMINNASAVSFVITQGVEEIDLGKGQYKKAPPTSEHYIRGFGDRLQILDSRANDYEDLRMFCQGFTRSDIAGVSSDPMVRIAVFPKILYEFIVDPLTGKYVNPNFKKAIVDVVQATSGVSAKNISLGKDTLSDDDRGKVSILANYLNDYVTSLVDKERDLDISRILSEASDAIECRSAISKYGSILTERLVALSKGDVSTSPEQNCEDSLLFGKMKVAVRAINFLKSVNNTIEHKVSDWTLMLSTSKELHAEPYVRFEDGIFFLRAPIAGVKDIKQKIDKDNAKHVQVSSYLFVVDDDLELKGADVSIMSTTWNLAGKRYLNLSGKHGESYHTLEKMKATEGKGQDGSDGGSAGNFYGHALNVRKLTNDAELVVNVSGGVGGQGQNGADATKFDIESFKLLQQQLIKIVDDCNRNIEVKRLLQSLPESSESILEKAITTISEKIYKQNEGSIDEEAKKYVVKLGVGLASLALLVRELESKIECWNNYDKLEYQLKPLRDAAINHIFAEKNKLLSLIIKSEVPLERMVSTLTSEISYKNNLLTGEVDKDITQLGIGPTRLPQLIIELKNKIIKLKEQECDPEKIRKLDDAVARGTELLCILKYSIQIAFYKQQAERSIREDKFKEKYEILIDENSATFMVSAIELASSNAGKIEKYTKKLKPIKAIVDELPEKIDQFLKAHDRYGEIYRIRECASEKLNSLYAKLCQSAKDIPGNSMKFVEKLESLFKAIKDKISWQQATKSVFSDDDAFPFLSEKNAQKLSMILDSRNPLLLDSAEVMKSRSLDGYSPEQVRKLYRQFKRNLDNALEKLLSLQKSFAKRQEELESFKVKSKNESQKGKIDGLDESLVKELSKVSAKIGEANISSTLDEVGIMQEYGLPMNQACARIMQKLAEDVEKTEEKLAKANRDIVLVERLCEILRDSEEKFVKCNKEYKKEKKRFLEKPEQGEVRSEVMKLINELVEAYEHLKECDNNLLRCAEEESSNAKEFLLNEALLHTRIEKRFHDKSVGGQVAGVLKELLVFNRQYEEKYILKGSNNFPGGKAGIHGANGVAEFDCAYFKSEEKVFVASEDGSWGEPSLCLEGKYLNEYSYPSLRGIKEKRVAKAPVKFSIIDPDYSNDFEALYGEIMVPASKIAARATKQGFLSAAAHVALPAVVATTLEQTALQSVSKGAALAVPGAISGPIGIAISLGLLATQLIASPIVAELSSEWISCRVETLDNSTADSKIDKLLSTRVPHQKASCIDKKLVTKNYIDYLQSIKASTDTLSKEDASLVNEELGHNVSMIGSLGDLSLYEIFVIA